MVRNILPILLFIGILAPSCWIYYQVCKDQHALPDNLLLRARLHIAQMFCFGLVVVLGMYNPVVFGVSNLCVIPMGLAGGIWIWRIILHHRESEKPSL